MTDTPDDFKDPKTFQSVREGLGLSQSQFAEVIGLQPDKDQPDGRSIRRYETGESPVSGPLARLMWFLHRYGIPPGFVD